MTDVSADCHLPIPGGGRILDGCEFVVNAAWDEPCDFWIVLGFAFPEERAVVAPQNTLFICGEPLEKKRFPLGFYRQFNHVVDTHNYSRHPRLELHAQCLGWGVGGLYDPLAEMPRPDKINRVGVVCSSTAQTPGQRKRLRFLAYVKEALGDQIMHFGRGFQPITNKLDGILPYRYQLVLENSVSDHYWTEKLADAYLGWGFPIYVGCPNVDQYFSPDAFHRVDLDHPQEAVALIRRLLATSESPQEIEAVRAARMQVLTEYNLIFRCAALARRHHQKAPKQTVLIRNYKYFRKRSLPGRLLSRLNSLCS